MNPDESRTAGGRHRSPHPVLVGALIALVLVILGTVFALFFSQLPVESTSLALDWRGIYTGLIRGVRYGSGVRNPPWSLALLLPLRVLSMPASWGVWNFVSLLILLLSVPRHAQRARFWLSALLLIVSYPILRLFADGNLDPLTLAGALLCVIGYQKRHSLVLTAGILLASTKPQASVLLLLVLGLYVLQTWPLREWLRLGGWLAIIVIPAMLWRGQEWLEAVFGIQQRGSLMDVSLNSTLTRAGLSPTLSAVLWLAVLGLTLFIAWRSDRTFSRYKAAMLAAASLLIAPYSAGNTVLVVMAVGVIPLFQARPGWGLLLIALIDLPFLIPTDALLVSFGYYSTLLLLLLWATMIVQIGREAPIRKPASSSVGAAR